MINILFLFMCLVAGITGRIFDTMQSTLMEDLEIEKELKLINKAPVKTIYVFLSLFLFDMSFLFNYIFIRILIIFLLFEDVFYRQNLDTFLIALILTINQVLIILYWSIISCRYVFNQLIKILWQTYQYILFYFNFYLFFLY